MKLPKETTLWNWAIIGLGLIAGVAIIGLMNFLNEYLHFSQGESAIVNESNTYPVSSAGVYYTGKMISILSGCFTAGAIIKMGRPGIRTSSLVVVGFIFMALNLIDLIFYTYPMWYQIFSIILPIPSVIIGNRLIK